MIPGSIAIVLSLFAFTQIGADTPYSLILGVHILLMVSLAALFTPVFTLGLGDVPMHLYSHGSSMLGTIQQVAGAFGTALVITVMTSRAKSQLADGVPTLEAATIDGMQLAFLVSAVIALAVVVLAVDAAEPSGRGPARRSGAEKSATWTPSWRSWRTTSGSSAPGLPVDGTDQHHPELGARVSR